MLEYLKTAIYTLALHSEHSSRIEVSRIRSVGFTDLLMDDARIAEPGLQIETRVGASCMFLFWGLHC